MRLLLVEDEPLTAQMLAKGLREQAYAVDVARSSRAARELANGNTYDLIVLDLGLPDGDGLTLCRELRSAGTPTPILILTARDAVAARIAGLDSGADDYLLKPFDLGELLARLRALARRGSRPPQHERLRIGELVLETGSQDAYCHGMLLPLTTRSTRCSSSWPGGPAKSSRAARSPSTYGTTRYHPLSNADRRVRPTGARQADPGGCQDVIRTRRGAGYILSADRTSED